MDIVDKPLSPNEVARRLLVSVGVIHRACDSGTLRCYRLPGSKHRKITRQAVIEFLKREGWPQDIIDRFE